MRRRRRKELAQASDIAFLLIIFFLLLAGLDATKALSLKQGISSTEQTNPSGVLSLTLSSDGSIVDSSGKTLSLSDCESLIPSYERIDLSVSPDATWQAVVDLLALANESQTEVNIHAT